jgi:poly(A) polymerase
MSFRIYQVGGSVRDEILGHKSKDYDFVFCLDDIKNKTVDRGWEEMLEFLRSSGYEIFLETKDCFTIRAKFPKEHIHSGMVADFVMARRELGYNRGVNRTPEVQLGTLQDDLLRRDFTVNAIAKDINGGYIDFFNGRDHIKEMRLYTPLDPMETFQDDPLRVLRALRFVVTKGFSLSTAVSRAIRNPKITEYFHVVSTDRIRDELNKCFRHSTEDSLILMQGLNMLNPTLWKHIWQRDIWLKPTSEGR